MEHGIAMDAAIAQAAHVVAAVVLADDGFDADMQQSLAALGALTLVGHVDFLRFDRGSDRWLRTARASGDGREFAGGCCFSPTRERCADGVFSDTFATPSRPGVAKNRFIVRARAGANAMLLWSAVRSCSTLGGRGRELINRCVLAAGITVSCPARTTRIGPV